MPIIIFSPVANFGDHPLRALLIIFSRVSEELRIPIFVLRFDSTLKLMKHLAKTTGLPKSNVTSKLVHETHEFSWILVLDP